MWDASTPAITTMLRGLCGEEIVITRRRPRPALGLLRLGGGNPNHVLARILADLRDADGRVTAPGLLRRRAGAARGAAREWAKLDFDPAAFLGEVGLSVPAGEKGRSALEMTWSRPTCEVNGMGGGYQGEGFKTVIPAQASAKISFRLVFDQDPARGPRDLPRLRPRAAAGRLQGRVHRAWLRHAPSLSIDAPGVPEDAAGADRRMGQGRRLHRRRRLDPGDDAIKNELGIDVVMAGFGLDDDRIHSPNEKYELKSFHHGIRSWARVLDALARS